MKAENIECLLYYYIKERNKYDAVDGVIKDQGGHYRECGENAGYVSSSEEEYQEYPMKRFLRGGGEVQCEVVPVIELPFLHVPLTADQQVQLTNTGRKLAELTDDFFCKQYVKCNIQFENNCLFVQPKKQTISIPIIRSSCTDVISKLTWQTCDRSAVSNIHYIAASGELVFEKGETKKFIEIQILDFSVDNSDLRFQVRLSVQNGEFNPKPMTVNIRNIDNFDDNERQVIECLLNSTVTSVSDMLSILKGSLNNRTFHTALSYLCSTADSVPLEVGLAFELTQSCINHLQYNSFRSILTDFFHFLPDGLEI